MKAPVSDALAPGASMSSSGFADGLGHRVLAFDREDGVMLERLAVRPELAALEPLLRARLDRIAAIDDERIARPRTMHRTGDGGLVVISEFVPGIRLSDLLENAADQGAAPGVDAAMGFLLGLLPALCGFHATAGFAHGTIAPERLVLTPAGRVVLLDTIFGDALQHLGYGERTLWRKFGLVVRPSAGRVTLDVDADITQATLCAVMLVLGRPLRDEDGSRMRNLLRDVVEVAEIRGSAAFARGMQAFLERALPLRGGRPFASADDALIEVRELSDELGLDVCGRALADCIDQAEEAHGTAVARLPGTFDVPAGGGHTGWSPVTEPARAPARDTFRLEILGDEDEPDGSFASPAGIELVPEDEEHETELSLEWPPADDAVHGREIPEPPPSRAGVKRPTLVTSPASPRPAVPSPPTAQPVPSPPLPPAASAAILDESADPSASALAAGAAAAGQPAMPGTEAAAGPPPGAGLDETRPPESQGALPSLASEALLSPSGRVPATADTPQASSDGAVSAGATAGTPGVSREATAGPDVEASPKSPAVRLRRAKRSRSARARKDKLRSAAAPAPLAGTTAPAEPVKPQEPEIPVPEPDATEERWLVPPSRAAAFEPPVPDAPVPPPAFPAPAPIATPAAVARPAPPAFAAQAAAPPSPAVYPSTPTGGMPAYGAPALPPQVASPYAPALWTPPPVVLPAPPATAVGTLTGSITTPGPLKLKELPPVHRTRRAPQVVDIYAPTVTSPLPHRTAGSRFPWKLAGAAVLLMLLAVGGGHFVLPAGSGAPETGDEAGVAGAEPAGPEAPAAARTGRLEIETQPPGARILLDGKVVGESPLSLDDVPPGRRTLTIASAAGSIRRTVRIEAGRTSRIDVPIFSGWVEVTAPFVVQVASGGRMVGTTEESRLMLAPGRHELTLTNAALGYKSVHTLDVEPGEVTPIAIDPRGHANFNATPWAEVWIDGRRIGETPIARLDLPLGTREVTFRHPDLGERRGTITVRADQPAILSVDMLAR